MARMPMLLSSIIPFFFFTFLHSNLLHLSNRFELNLSFSFPLFSPSLTQHKTILRSYSQDFAPLCQSSIPYLLSSVSSHSPIVHQSQSMDLAAPGTGSPDPVLVANGSLDSSGGSLAICLLTDSSFSDTRQTSLVSPSCVF